jgi:hypothetical protein
MYFHRIDRAEWNAPTVHDFQRTKIFFGKQGSFRELKLFFSDEDEVRSSLKIVRREVVVASGSKGISCVENCNSF